MISSNLELKNKKYAKVNMDQFEQIKALNAELVLYKRFRDDFIKLISKVRELNSKKAGNSILNEVDTQLLWLEQEIFDI